MNSCESSLRFDSGVPFALPLGWARVTVRTNRELLRELGAH